MLTKAVNERAFLISCWAARFCMVYAHIIRQCLISTDILVSANVSIFKQKKLWRSFSAKVHGSRGYS